MNDTLNLSKSGVVTTDANGVALVLFREQFKNPTTYIVVLTVLDAGNTIAAIPYPSNLANTGFTINTRDTKVTGGTYNQTPNITVHWKAEIVSN